MPPEPAPADGTTGQTLRQTVDEGRPSTRWKLWSLVLLVVVILCWALALSGVDWRGWIEGHPHAGVLIFCALMILLPLVGFPISAFYVFAGLTFSVPYALGSGGVALAVNMVLGYWLARTVWREPLKRRLEARWPHLFTLDRNASAQVTLLVRAVPGVPYAAQNYLLGVLAVPFFLYLGISWGVQFLFLTGVVLTTRGVMGRDSTQAFWGGLAVLVVVVSLRLAWRRWRGRRI
ncbi:MAG: TVP38/TMEM64 family protein [Puniceicoccales bacterium]